MRIFSSAKTKFLLTAALFSALFLLFACISKKDGEKPDPFRTPEPERIVQITVLPSEIAVVTPTPEPPRLDFAPLRVSERETLYDVTPLLEKERTTILFSGFSDDGRLIVYRAGEDGSQLLIDQFDLRYGDLQPLYAFGFSPASVLLNREIEIFSYDPPLFYNYPDSILYAYDAGSGKLQTYAREPNRTTECWWNEDGSILVYEGSSVTVRQLEPDGKERVLFQPDFRYQNAWLTSLSADHRYAAFNATDSFTQENVTFLADLSDGSIRGLEDGYLFINFSDDGYYALQRDTVDQGPEASNLLSLTYKSADTLSSDTVKHVLREKEESYPVIHPFADGYLLEDWGAGYLLSVTDLSGEEQYSVTVPLDAFDPWQNPETTIYLPEPDPNFDEYADESGDYEHFISPSIAHCAASDRFIAVCVENENGVCAVLLWEYPLEASETAVPLTFAERLFAKSPRELTYTGSYSERIQAIYDTYGIQILLGDDASLYVTTHVTETLQPEEEPERFEECFQILEETLAEYPPDFFRTLCKDYINGIVVEYCGTIRSRDEYSLDYPSALTCMIGEYRLIVFDAYYTGDMRYTIFHEISHMIDSKMDRIAAYDDPHWTSDGWEAMNPADFAYYYAYNNEKGEAYDVAGSDKYTPMHKDYWKRNKTDSVYFVDRYSKTFPTEDRAVLFGTLMRDDSNDEILRCPHILEKLRYYFDAIRFFFDPDGAWQQNPPGWELRYRELTEENVQKDAA